MENSPRDGNTRQPDLPPEKSACRAKAKLRTGHGATDCFQIGKGVCQGCIQSLCILFNCMLFNFYAENIMRNAGLEETQAGINIAGININNLRYEDDTPPYGRK